MPSAACRSRKCSDAVLALPWVKFSSNGVNVLTKCRRQKVPAPETQFISLGEKNWLISPPDKEIEPSVEKEILT